MGVEEYVHRIGRTGRAGATGQTYTFFGDQDAKHASNLVKLLEWANQRVPDEIRDMASRGGRGNKFKCWGSTPSFKGRDGGGGGRPASSFSRRSSFAGARDCNRFSFGGYQQQMSFHDNVGVFKRSVAGENALLEKLSQDGESAALIDLTRHPQWNRKTTNFLQAISVEIVGTPEDETPRKTAQDDVKMEGNKDEKNTERVTGICGRGLGIRDKRKQQRETFGCLEQN
nr:DEAD-box ATP-dependent RNA helicase 14-like [Tanacetum cinerariifolium]